MKIRTAVAILAGLTVMALLAAGCSADELETETEQFTEVRADSMDELVWPEPGATVELDRAEPGTTEPTEVSAAVVDTSDYLSTRDDVVQTRFDSETRGVESD